MTNNLIQYIRNRSGAPIGVVVATKLSDSTVGVGWSKLHVSAGDTWDRERGIQIAIERATCGTNKVVPHAIVPVIESMQKRAKAYFKGAATIVAT